MGSGELQLRRRLINSAIRECSQHGATVEVIEKYRAQLARIDGEIQARRRGEYQNNGGPPPGIEVQAEIGTLSARVKE